MLAPRDTFIGVGVGRKAGFETGEAINWGHSFLAGWLRIDVILVRFSRLASR